jgi:DNA-binding transcriptional MerR regulator
MLTIGQLAKHCGVTVRAVRHYHRIGLLPEPGRDASGYRRYGAKAVVSLFRIKVLAEAGVPLVRVGQLLEAGPADFAAAVADVDLALRGQIAQLEQRRRQLAGLAAGDRLFVSGEVADLLDQLAAVGASERAIAVEKDGWTLIEALAPELASYLAKRKRAALSDPEFCRLYLACDHAWDLDPGDDGLEELAASIAEWLTKHAEAAPGLLHGSSAARTTLVRQLLDAEPSNSSPAWRRLQELANGAFRGSACIDRPGRPETRERHADERTLLQALTERRRPDKCES